MLVLTRKQNQTIHIGNDITIHIARIKGNTVQLGIDAPREVRILRSELAEKIEEMSAVPASPNGFEVVPDETNGQLLTSI